MIEWFGVATEKVGPYSDTPDGKVVFFCGGDHLNLIDEKTGVFRDPLHGNSRVQLKPGMSVACSGGYESFGYELAGGGFAVVLCGHFERGALLANTAGLVRYRTSMSQGQSVDAAKVLMTTKILHEMVHAADSINQCKDIAPTSR